MVPRPDPRHRCDAVSVEITHVDATFALVEELRPSPAKSEGEDKSRWIVLEARAHRLVDPAYKRRTEYGLYGLGESWPKSLTWVTGSRSFRLLPISRFLKWVDAGVPLLRWIFFLLGTRLPPLCQVPQKAFVQLQSYEEVVSSRW